MSKALWVRGLLENVFGVDTSKLSYRIGGLNEPGHEECLSLDLSPGMGVVAIPPDTTFDAKLNAGELDVVIAPSPPKALVEDVRKSPACLPSKGGGAGLLSTNWRIPDHESDRHLAGIG